MYMEYAKNEIANSNQYIDTYNFILDYTNGTWVHSNIMHPYFGPKVGKKLVGERLIFWIIVPVVLNTIFAVYMLCSCLCNKYSRARSAQSSKV